MTKFSTTINYQHALMWWYGLVVWGVWEFEAFQHATMKTHVIQVQAQHELASRTS